jgi:predicted amidohydrolase YtcJ
MASQRELGSVSDTGPADLAFVGGAVYTVNAARSWAQAVAVKNGRIVTVGTDADVRERVGPATEIVPLHGGMLLPGFQDAHVHPVSSGLERLLCDLHDVHSADAYLRIIQSYAQEHPDREWILGGGWSMDVFPSGSPGKELLDALVPDRFVYLESRDGHSAWVNSRAIELAGISAATLDPADGRIQRDAAGGPGGTLHEGAMDLVAPLAPQPSAEDFVAGLLAGQRYLHSLGITAWQDAIVGWGPDADTLAAYVGADERGELTARVAGALWWDRHLGEEQIEGLVAARGRGRGGRFRANSVKIMQDGVLENFTAAVLEPYLDAAGAPTQNRGISFVEPGLLKRVVTSLDALGFQVHFHTIGDRAVREALDAIEAALAANGPTDHRHHLAHIQIVHPDDVPRFRALGAVANAQPLWAAHEPQLDELTTPFLGDPRWRWQYPFGSLVRAGATLAMGSDWSVSSPNPLEEIHVAVNRVMPPGYTYGGEPGAEPFLPEERLDLPTAIAAFTTGSAYVNHLEDETGSIEVGKHGDLVVLDRNVFEHPAEEIAAARVLGTYVAGERVFAAEAT